MLCNLYTLVLRHGISTNKDVTVIGDPALQVTQEEKEHLWSDSHQAAATPYQEPWETQDVKNSRVRAPIAEMHMKGMISLRPDSCIFPYKEKHPIP